MARDFVDLRNNDVLEPYHINMCYKEFRRLRRLKVTAPLALEGMESADGPPVIRFLGYSQTWVQLTANGSGGLHDWQQMQWNGTAYETTLLTGTSALGDQARELNGLNCPLGDDIYRAWRDNYGVLVFEARPVEAVLSGALSAGTDAALSAANATVWSYQAGVWASASLTVTATHRYNQAFASGKQVSLMPRVNKWFVWVGGC